MEEWKEVRLEECVSLLGDGLHGTPKYTENGEYAFINGNNLINGKIVIKPETKRVNEDEYLKYKKNLTDRTIFVSINGTIGNVGTYNGEKIILGKSACYFNVLDDIDKTFIKYVVSSPLFKTYLETNATGTTIKNVSLAQMRNYSFLIPPLPTQQKIARILSSLDDKIELNNKINTNLEQQAQAFFKNWFVDFEPFGGKMPEGWRSCKAEEYFDITIGKTPPRKEQEWFSEKKNEKTIKWVSISDMGDCGIYIFDSSEYLTLDACDKFNVTIIPIDTVILSFKLTVGRVAITDDAMCSNEAIAHFKTDRKEINEYLYIYLKNFNYQTMGSTSSIAVAVNSKIIKAMPFVVPDNKTINQFHDLVGSFFYKIRKNQRENRNLASLRDTLLPKLMNGEIEV